MGPLPCTEEAPNPGGGERIEAPGGGISGAVAAGPALASALGRLGHWEEGEREAQKQRDLKAVV